MKKTIYSAFLLAAIFVGCKSEGEEKKDDGAKAPTKEAVHKSRPRVIKNMVDTMHLKKSTFSKQINCNGKLRAIAKSELAMPATGILTQLNVGNGSYVKKGELMAVTDVVDLEFDVKKAKREIERNYVDLIDELISLGYGQDTTEVPSNILQRAKITSGYYTALDQYESASRKLSKCYLYAPFAGRVANIESKVHENTSKFCTLIDDSYFNVEFNILEAEIAMSRVGQRVVVFPFIDENKEFVGKITEINPLVDDRGQVMVRAKIKNNNGYLVEGMNVRVIMENNSPNMFVVPKNAVILRDGVYVAFRMEDGMALWTYVDVIHSNLDSYAIVGNSKKRTLLRDGDIIITSGNLNLSDGTPVTPKEDKAAIARKKAEAAKKKAEAAKTEEAQSDKNGNAKQGGKARPSKKSSK